MSDWTKYVREDLRIIIDNRGDYFNTRDGIEIRREYLDEKDGRHGEYVTVNVGQAPDPLVKVFQFNVKTGKVTYCRYGKRWVAFVGDLAEEILPAAAKNRQKHDDKKNKVEEEAKTELEKKLDKKPFDDSQFFKAHLAKKHEVQLTAAEKDAKEKADQAELAKRRAKGLAKRRQEEAKEAEKIKKALIWQHQKDLERQALAEAAAAAKAELLAKGTDDVSSNNSADASTPDNPDDATIVDFPTESR